MLGPINERWLTDLSSVCIIAQQIPTVHQNEKGELLKICLFFWSGNDQEMQLKLATLNRSSDQSENELN